MIAEPTDEAKNWQMTLLDNKKEMEESRDLSFPEGCRIPDSSK